MKYRILTLCTAALLIGAVACDDGIDDPDFEDPTMQSLAGDWVARADTGLFVLSFGGLADDLLEEGAYVELSLQADGQASGQLFVPEDEDGLNDEGADETFGGTWDLAEDDDVFFIDLDHDADTFLRDVALFVDTQDQLVVDAVSGAGERIQLVLIRTD
jgi:hypothetical protein